MLRDQQAPAGVDVKGARMNGACFDVLNRCRLAGFLVYRVHDDVVLAAFQYTLACYLDGGPGTICAI
ncbi:hypothetical protein D3C83_67480 [compost metagenome]